MIGVGEIARRKITDAKDEIDGKTLGKPALLVSDGLNSTYGVDVDIGVKKIDTNTADEVVVPLRNVPIAAGNNELIYADAGAPVRLRRSVTGQWEIIGFAKRFPGTYTRVPVHIPAPTLGPLPYTSGDPTPIGLRAYRIPYGELSDFGAYGSVPYGAIAIYRGDTLIEVR